MALSKVVIFGLVILVVGLSIGLGVYFGASENEEDTTIPSETTFPPTTSDNEVDTTTPPETTNPPNRMFQ